jgi:hypothetical protein
MQKPYLAMVTLATIAVLQAKESAVDETAPVAPDTDETTPMAGSKRTASDIDDKKGKVPKIRSRGRRSPSMP